MQRIIRLFPGLLLALWLLNSCTVGRPTVRTLELLALRQVGEHSSAKPESLPETAATMANDSVLLQMLRYVPNEPWYREYLTFGDVGAWYRATGMMPVHSVDEWRQLAQPQRDRWAYALPMQTMPPDTLGLRYMMMEDMRDFCCSV